MRWEQGWVGKGLEGGSHMAFLEILSRYSLELTGENRQ